MMTITAANTANLPTRCAARAEKPYAKRTQAQAAAVASIGPHAREGFEFDTCKVDGGWRWRASDEVRPDTDAQIKANGGKKASAPAKLPVPPRKAVKTPQVAPLPGMTPSGVAEKALAKTDGTPSLMNAKKTSATKAPNGVVVGATIMPSPKSRLKPSNRKTKIQIVADLLKRDGGCTAAEALAATGWPTISMPATAKAAGLSLTKLKEKGKATQYRAE